MLLQRGGALPSGNVRNWGGKEYIKAGSGAPESLTIGAADGKRDIRPKR